MRESILMDISSIPLLDLDDKDKVIIAAAAIALTSLFQLEPDSASSIVNSIVSGLFGMAVGRKTS